jgi:hypothetical protein
MVKQLVEKERSTIWYLNTEAVQRKSQQSVYGIFD